MLAAVTGMSTDQRARLDGWLGPWEVVADRSWPLQDMTVLHVRNADGDHIVKMRDPRNWVIDDGRVAVIDFERGPDRSWVSDLVRLQNQQFAGHPERERAFMAGLDRTIGHEDAELLAIESLRQSLGTVVWAHSIGNQAFEEHGRTMITRFLSPPASHHPRPQ